MPYTGLHRFMCISLFAQSYSSIIQYNQLVIEDESKSERHRKKNETLFLLGRRFSNNVMLCIWYRSMYVLCFSLLFLLSISPFAISFEFCCVVCFFFAGYLYFCVSSHDFRLFVANNAVYSFFALLLSFG